MHRLIAILTAASMVLTMAAPALAAPPEGPGNDAPPAAAIPRSPDAATPSPPPAPSSPQAAPLRTSPGQALDACQGLSDAEIQKRLPQITSQTLNNGLGTIDYSALVGRYWRQTGMDHKLDAQIDDAIATVRADTTWLGRAYSTVSRETATELAKKVANKTYDSEGFRLALSDLTRAIGQDIGHRIEAAAASVPGPVIACIQTALESRYGGAIAQAFAQQTSANFDISATAAQTRIDTTDLAIHSSQAISGLILILSRRLVARMVAQIGRRLAGLIATRIVATFTGLIGLALIVKDVVEAGEGVFPLIAERMKSDESKAVIKKEIAQSIEAYVREHVLLIAQETATRMHAAWLDFRQKHEALIRLAETNETFAAFLRSVNAQQIAPLGDIVAIILRKEGEAGVLRRTQDGSLGEALSELDAQGLIIANKTGSLEHALAWTRLAGPLLGEVVRYSLYETLGPTDISRENLSKLLALGDPRAIKRVADLAPAARAQLLDLPLARLKVLARRLSDDQLAALATYQARLPAELARRLLNAVAEDSQRMRQFASPGVAKAVLASRDPTKAVKMLLNSGGYFSFARFSDDLTSLRAGDVQWRVFLEAHFVTLLAGLFLALIALLLLASLFRRPRQTIVVKTNSDGAHRR